jgi:hypothetical protein
MVFTDKSGHVRFEVLTAETEECRLLGCGTVQILYEPTFRRKVSPPFSGYKIEAFHTKSTRSHIPEDGVLKSGDVTVTKTDAFSNQLATCFVPERSSGYS